MDLYIEPIKDNNGVFKYYDIVFDAGKLKVVDKIDEIKNRITVNLNTHVGENYMDTSHGVDYFNNVYNHDVTDTITQDEFKSVIAKTRGVTAILAFSLTRVERAATLTAHIQTTQGEIDLTTDIQI